MMIFTSGTGGDPKALRFAHAMAVMCGASLVDRFELTSDDVCYLSMPLFHPVGVEQRHRQVAHIVGGEFEPVDQAGAAHHRIAWANRTAFGSPLVPDVKIIKTGSAPFTSRCGTSGFAAATASR